MVKKMNYKIEWKGSPNFRVQKGVKKKYIVFHWIVGTLNSATSIFQNADRRVATNYGVGEGRIHQYVADKDYAFGSGNTEANKYGISIEHEGGWMTAKGRKKPTQKTLETSAWLCAKIARDNNLGELIPGKNAFPHSKWVSTSCPGTLDWHWICKRANEINAALAKPVEAPKPVAPVIPPVSPVSPVQTTKPVVLKDPTTAQWKVIQKRLAAKWGYKGAIDGVPGKLTWSAVQRYLKANFGYTGKIDGVAGALTKKAWDKAGRTVK